MKLRIMPLEGINLWAICRACKFHPAAKGLQRLEKKLPVGEATLTEAKERIPPPLPGLQAREEA